MINFDAYRPNPCAPQLFGGIYRVSQSITKVAFTLSTGPEVVETASLLWENAALYEAQLCLDWASSRNAVRDISDRRGGRLPLESSSTLC